jgi:hypothetical protein
MSRRENIFRKSTMSYENYESSYENYELYNNSIQEEYLDNDWGWFVDIEMPINKNNIKCRKHVSVSSEVYRIEEDYTEKIDASYSWISQAICIVIVTLILF